MTEDWSVRRADARRNHERVLRAAIELFTEQGLEATIPAIAQRAGVGKATVYRSYPTKSDLLLAIAEIHVEWISQRLALANRAESATEGFTDLITTLMTRLATDRLMVTVFTGLHAAKISLHDADPAQAAKLDMELSSLIAAAATEGGIRADASSRDLQIICGGIAGALYDVGIDDKATWQRYAEIALNSLRP